MSSSKRSTIIVEHLRKQQMWDSISKGKRLDGRNLDEIRPIEIEFDIIKKANGSAKVKLGNTEVVAGVKVETGEPFEGLENKSCLIHCTLDSCKWVRNMSFGVYKIFIDILNDLLLLFLNHFPTLLSC